MPIKKGQVLNPGGRPKGSLNKNTTAIRDMWHKIITDNKSEIENKVAEMLRGEKASKSLELFIQMSAYFIPKLSAQNISLDSDQPINIILPANPKDKKQKDMPDNKNIDTEQWTDKK